MAEAKTSYTLPCSSAFRDAVLALADKRQVNAADLARSILLTVPARLLELYPDPGGPNETDRETITLKSGSKAGKSSVRKPRLQVRMPSGLTVEIIRKALNLALAFDSETMLLQVRDPQGPALGDAPAPPSAPTVAAEPPPPPPPDLAPQLASAHADIRRLSEDLDRLRAVLDVVSFDPLPEGVQTYGEALFVFGYPPTAHPDSREIRGRFRILASVHHPDSPYGSHNRMSQINAAMDLLRQR
jgi:hypothetical protein